MSSADLPSWQERLGACFRIRHRLLHVIGVPLALGGITAVVSSGSLHDKAVTLGFIVALVGILFAGWFVVSGLDRKLVAELQAGKRGTRGKGELETALASASPETRALLDRIRVKLDAVEPAVEKATMQGGTSPAMLEGLHDDLVSLRHKIVAIANALPKLNIAKATSDVTRLEAEIARLASELDEVTGSLRDALDASKTAAEAELARCRAAIELGTQLTGTLGTIEADLGVVDKAVATGVVVNTDGERARERLAFTLGTCDRLLQAGRR